MASIRLKRLLGCLLICFCSIFLMSHNTYALDISQSVEFKQTWTNNVMRCAVRYGTLVTTVGNTCVFGTNTGTNLEGSGLSWISTADVNLVQGDYYQFYLDVSVSDGAQYAIPVMWNLNTSNNFTIVDFEQVSNNNNMGTTSEKEAYVTTYSIILRSSVNNSSYPIELGYSDFSKNMLYYAGDFWTSPIDVRITRINRYSPKTDNTQSVIDAINNQSSEPEEATQDAADNASNAGSSSAASAESATSSLVSVIGGFVSAITTATPTNCKINGKINNSFDMGELDLCAMPVPSFVQIISSLILIAICIPFAIIMFNRFIGLFRSFQG